LDGFADEAPEALIRFGNVQRGIRRQRTRRIFASSISSRVAIDNLPTPMGGQRSCLERAMSKSTHEKRTAARFPDARRNALKQSNSLNDRDVAVESTLNITAERALAMSPGSRHRAWLREIVRRRK
jgi:hypothetical protein